VASGRVCRQAGGKVKSSQVVQELEVRLGLGLNDEWLPAFIDETHIQRQGELSVGVWEHAPTMRTYMCFRSRGDIHMYICTYV
jgi:hypothetical protein